MTGTAVWPEVPEAASAAAADAQEPQPAEREPQLWGQAPAGEVRQVPSSGAAVDTRSTEELEAEHSKRLDTMLPLLEDKAIVAEDDAEKVAILAAPLQIEIIAELQELQMESVRETEKAVRTALASLNTVLRDIDRSGKEIDAMAPKAKERGKEALAKLTARLDIAKLKLDEHKSVRKDYEMSLAAEKDFGDLATRLAGVEIECEKAAVMAEPLVKSLDVDPESISMAEIRETKEALRVAQTTLAPTMRLISGRIAGLKGGIRTKLLELTSRAESAQSMLDAAQKTIEEAQARAAAAPILKAAVERIANIEDLLSSMRETEMPFLIGDENMSSEERSSLIEVMETTSAKAHADLSDTLRFIDMKTGEVTRLPEATAGTARTELNRAKLRVETALGKVKKFQLEAATRKRDHLIEIVKQKVEVAEAAVLKLKETGAELTTLQGAEPADLTDTLQKSKDIESEARTAVATARKELDQKQGDLGKLESERPELVKTNGEFTRTKVRVNYVESELAKFQRLARELDEKVEVDRSLTATSATLTELDKEADRLQVASESWASDQKPPEEDEKSISDAQQKMSQTTEEVEGKLKSAQGLELKALRGVFGRLTRVQDKLDRVRDMARDRNKAVSSRILREAQEAVQRAEREVSKVTGMASSLSDESVDKLESMNKQALASLEIVAEADQALAKSDSSLVVPEAKVDVRRLQFRFKAVDTKIKAAAGSITEKFEQVLSTSMEQTLTTLRADARGDGRELDASSLFSKIKSSEEGCEITEQQFCDYFKGKEVDMSSDMVRLAFRRIAPHGLRRHTFGAALADVRKVVREMTLTDVFEIKTAKKIRKLALGEFLEVLGPSKEESSIELERAECRAILDGTVGWVSLKGKAGAVYLKRADKPFMWCSDSTRLRKASEEESEELRELSPGEVLELVEGPKTGKPGDMRVRGVACSEETTGWLHIKDSNGVVSAELNEKICRCVEGVAMTQEADFAKCTSVRRIEAGEALELLPDEAAEPGDGATRHKFRACVDGKEGWVTMNGNKGKVFVKSVTNHYVCLKETPIIAGSGAESAVIRTLNKGEAFAAVDDPKEVCGGEKLSFYHVRAIIDGAQGWVSTSQVEDKIQRWSSRYKVLRPITLTNGLMANEAAEVVEVIRMLEIDELVDIAEHPTVDSSTGQLRARCVTRKDKKVGWATVRDVGGTGLNLRPVSPEEEEAAAQEEKAAESSAKPDRPRGEKRSLDTKDEEDQDKGARGASRGPWIASTGGRAQSHYLPSRAQPSYYTQRYDMPPPKRWKGGGGKGRKW